MNKKGRLYLLVLTGMLWLVAQDSFAQLLEDRNKLKTADKKYFKPFIDLNRNTKTKTNKRPKVDRQRKVRYSKASTPQKYAVNPRYSKWQFAGKVDQVNPRYSRPPKPVKITGPSNNGKKGFLPSFYISGPPQRYKQAPSAIAMSPPVKSKKSLKSDAKKKSSYTVKTKRQKKGKDMHPSANYLAVKGNDSKFIRDNMRKFNVKWVRMNGNKTQPKAVKQKPKKLKFDKDEREIWNN